MKPQFSNTLKEDFKETLINNLRKANSASDMSIDENDLNIDFLDHEIELSEDSSNDIPEFSCDNQRKNKQPFNFNGYISTCLHGSGRSTGDRQFFYINSRPCEPKKVIKVCNEIYKQYNPNQFPFVFLNILLKKSTVDVNVTPDKRKVFFDKEKILIEVLKHSLNKIFENIPSTVKFNNLNIQKSSEDLTPNVTNPRVFSSFLSQFSKNIENTDNPSTSVTPKRKSTTIENFISISKVKKIEETLSEENNLIGDSEIKITDDTELKKDDDTEMKIDDIEMKTDESEKLLDENETKLNIPSKELKHETVFLGYSEENDIRPSQVVTLDNILSIQNNINKSACFKQNSSEKYSPPKVGMTNYNSENHTPEKCERLLDLSIINTVIDIPGKIDQSDPSDLSKLPKSIDVKNTTKSSSIYKKSNEINISLEEIKNQMFESFSIEQKHKKNIDAVKFRSEINPKNNKQCEEELQKEISKNMFNQMNIIGQFNLGFIITQLNHDLFIIDQHATDEKYNFEELQNTTILSSQKLVM